MNKESINASAGAIGKPAATRPGVVPRRPTNALYRLSTGLLSTYKLINKKYYAKKKQQQKPAADAAAAPVAAAGAGGAAGAAAASSGQGVGAVPAPGEARAVVYNDGYDNKEGEYLVTPGDHLGYEKQLQIIKKIGNGQFGQVVKAWDKQRQVAIAVKIIRNRKIFLDQAQNEIKILNLLQSVTNSEKVIVRFFNNFYFRNHLCLTFELLSYNLYEVLVITRFQGLSLDAVRNVAEQLLRSLAILDDKGVIHCDLKPENVLLVDPEHSYVKLIDFGSSCMVGKTAFTYVQSRFYRAPEVILQLPYSVEIDIWSLGCMLVELHTGDPLFNGSSQNKQIGRFWEVLGPPPASMVTQSKVRDKFFSFRPAENVPNARPSFTIKPDCIRTGDTKMRTRNLWDICGGATGGPDGRFAHEAAHTPDDYKVFLDLIKRMLAYDPAERIHAREALMHPFITQRGLGSGANSSVNSPSSRQAVEILADAAAKLKMGGGGGGGGGPHQ